MGTATRIPSLDGLRAVAVLVVFFSHAEVVTFMPARFGVTIFFFLSGYIITTLMRSEFDRSNSVSFKHFYLRRVYRIFPPLYIVLALAALLTWFGLLPNKSSAPAILAQVFHLTNYYALFNDRFAFFTGTALLWSLSVEEHFYLLFPLLFLLLARRVSYERLALVLASICVAVLGWRLYLYYGLDVQSKWAFLATDTRIDSILYGCIMGIWCNPVKDRELISNPIVGVIVLIIALAALVFSVSYKDPAFQRTFMFTIQGVALFPIFALAITRPDWFVFRWLNWKPIVWIGWISYTFYLSHMIILVLTSHITEHIWLKMALALIFTTAFCSAMYIYIEKPLARKRAAISHAG